MNPPAGLTDLRDDARAALQRLLRSLVEIALVGPGTRTEPWRAEAREAQSHVARGAYALTGVRLDGLWTRAVREAESDPDVRRGETVNPALPTMAPLRLEALCAEPFDLDGAVQAIRDAASFG